MNITRNLGQVLVDNKIVAKGTREFVWWAISNKYSKQSFTNSEVIPDYYWRQIAGGIIFVERLGTWDRQYAKYLTSIWEAQGWDWTSQ